MTVTPSQLHWWFMLTLTGSVLKCETQRKALKTYVFVNIAQIKTHSSLSYGSNPKLPNEKNWQHEKKNCFLRRSKRFLDKLLSCLSALALRSGSLMPLNQWGRTCSVLGQSGSRVRIVEYKTIIIIQNGLDEKQNKTTQDTSGMGVGPDDFV